LPPHSHAPVSTGFLLKLPPNLCCEIKSCSGLAKKSNVTAFNSTIDSDFRDTLHVLLYNPSSKPFQVNKGDRIAQLVFRTLITRTITTTTNIDHTERGTGGSGSTGTNAILASLATISQETDHLQNINPSESEPPQNNNPSPPSIVTAHPDNNEEIIYMIFLLHKMIKVRATTMDKVLTKMK